MLRDGTDATHVRGLCADAAGRTVVLLRPDRRAPADPTAGDDDVMSPRATWWGSCAPAVRVRRARRT